MSEQKEQRLASAVLTGLMVADAALTLASRIGRWVQARKEVGELTPEEEAALDVYLENKFSEWQAKRPTSGPGETLN